MAKTPTTIVLIPELNKEGKAAQLTMRTSKGYSRVVSSGAHIEYKEPNIGTGFTGTSYEMFGDFRKNLFQAKVIATQKNLDAQHAKFFTPEVIEALKAEALAFYANKRREEAA